jgi:hypothetical protein
MIAITVVNMITNMAIMLWKTCHSFRFAVLRLKFKYRAWKISRQQQKYKEEEEKAL